MKAVICTKYGSPEVLQIREIEKPVPKDNEVLIKIRGAVVGATDPVFRQGKPVISRLFTGLTRPGNPVFGDALAGDIEAAGKSVTQFKQGDRVFGSIHMNTGAHAEYICLPENGVLAQKPENMTYTEAAAVCDGALIALPFLRDKGEIQSGMKALIYGASGSVGTFAVQIAKYFGAEVTGVCSTSNLEMVKSIGAGRVIDYTKEDFTKNGETYDIIFDTVAKSSFSSCKSSLVPNGIYLTTMPTPSVLLRMLFSSRKNGKRAVFAAIGTISISEKVKNLIFLKELIENGKLRPVIDRTYSLTQIAEAHSYVEKGHKKGNVALDID
ncbi:MAG: Zn-dependent oxidoreductase [Spirochaetes bacterium GWF1_51_8]|nr:MAG: Zn-dependent oxidoreductase [Spirochaetes bacterium GWF1_51_8]